MVYEGTLEGEYVDLRPCTEDDAEFTLALRQKGERSATGELRLSSFSHRLIPLMCRQFSPLDSLNETPEKV